MRGGQVWGSGLEEFFKVALTAAFTTSSADPVLPGPPIAPYSLPKEGVKWPPALQPSVGLGPPAPDPNLLAPPSGNPAGFRQLLPEDLEPGPLAPSQAPPEQLLPDLLISPHMLPCKNSGGLGRWAGQSGSGNGAGLIRKDDKENKLLGQSSWARDKLGRLGRLGLHLTAQRAMGLTAWATRCSAHSD